MHYKLGLALIQHLLELLKEKNHNKSSEIESLHIFNDQLEQKARESEYRELQMTGDHKTAKDKGESLIKQLHEV